VEFIRKGALLRDIGNLGIPTEILSKPSCLTADEYEVVKRHAILGVELMKKSPSLQSLIPIVRHHHEYFNGKGYPDNLMGCQIPIEARIVAVADTIAAMSSERPYRKALSISAVVDEIQTQAGAQFDPLVVDAALRMIQADSRLGTPDAETQPTCLHTFVPSA
jgi:HD-GYP domain-containing protein (c-di-GMP phosphodiesterase class II)